MITSAAIMSSSDSPAGIIPPRFSFIIVSFNTLDLTRAAVVSIQKHAAPFSREILLVDNHSTDGTVAALRREFADVVFIEFTENRGFAAANNAAGKIARGDWLILMNSDAELLADTMAGIDDLLRRYPQLDVLGGQLLNSDGSLQTSVLANYHLVRDETRELVEVDGIVGAFMVIRRAVWEKLNGMDENFFFYGEDADFCHRAIAAGAMLRWSPRFRVIHHRGASTKSVDLRAFVENWQGQHKLWRQKLSETEYNSRIRRYMWKFFFRAAWYFSLSVLSLFLLRAFTGRFRKYFYLFRWHRLGCPAGWGLNPAQND